MPLYLSQKRSAAVGYTNQRDSSFVRGEPSRFRYYVFSTSSSFVHEFFQFFAAASIAVFYFILHKTAGLVEAVNHRTTFLPLFKTDVIPFRNPSASVCFPNHYRMPADVEQMLRKYGAANAIKVFKGKTQYQVNEIIGIEDADLPLFFSLSAHSSSRYIATANTLTPGGYKAYLDILSVVTGVTMVMWQSFYTDLPNAGSLRLLVSSSIKSVSAEQKDIDIVGNEVRTKADAQKDKWTGNEARDVDSVFFSADPLAAESSAWGSVGTYGSSAGLTIPFRMDYSSPDLGIFFEFVRKFPSVFDKNALDDEVAPADEYIQWLEKWWKDEVANTVQGQWLAHLMKSLIISAECFCSCYAIVSEGRYQGCILGGGKWKIMANGEVLVPLLDEDFKADLRLVDPHTRVLNEILDLLAIPSAGGRALPKSLRALRSLVFATAVNGATKNRIGELLPQLIFPEEPTSCNPTTMKDTVTILTTPNAQVPDTEYLPVDEFYSEDKVRLTLSRFGRRAPSFSTGPTLIRFCSNASGPGITKAAPYSTHPPTIFQVEFVPITAAANAWSRLLTHGLQTIRADAELTGPHMVFRGLGGKEVWAHLGMALYDALDRGIGQGGTLGNPKRGREGDDEEEEEGEIPTVKKRKGFSMF